MTDVRREAIRSRLQVAQSAMRVDKPTAEWGEVAYLLATCDALQQERDEIKAAFDELFADMMCAFEERPNARGEYLHIGYCSASRSKPPGLPQSGCVCFRSVKRDRAKLTEAEAQIQRLTEAISGALAWMEPGPCGQHNCEGCLCEMERACNTLKAVLSSRSSEPAPAEK